MGMTEWHMGAEQQEPLLLNKQDEEAEIEIIHSSKDKASFYQTAFNALSAMLGIGLLSTPYALHQGGWIGLVIFLFFAVAFCYTGYQLGQCVAKLPFLTTYSDIGLYAFGAKGQALIAVFLYLEVLGVLVAYTISLGDNLAKLFPSPNLHISWLHLGPSQTLSVLTSFVILPTLFIPNLQWLSYLSLAAVTTSLALIPIVIWVGLFDGIGFNQSIPLLRVNNIVNATGIYAYCFNGHYVLPNIYISMRKPSQYPKMLITVFFIITLLYAGFAIIGAHMFGNKIFSQITLNMPKASIATHIALWIIVIVPISKYGLCITPITNEFEKRLLDIHYSIVRHAVKLTLRAFILFAILGMAFISPCFEKILGLVGSGTTMTMCMIFPCMCYLRLFRNELSKVEIWANYVLILVGVCLTIIGTVQALT